MKQNISKIHLNRIIFLYGIIASMPILTLFNFTFFTWLSLLIVVGIIINLFIEGKFYVSKILKKYSVLFSLSIITVILCLNSSIPSTWKQIQGQNLLWEIVYFLIISYLTQTRNERLRNDYFCGIYYGGIVQIFWGYLQFIINKFFNLSLNDLVFNNLLHMSTSTSIQSLNASMKITGLCWNAGNFAPLLLFVLIFTNNFYIKVITLFLALLSGSRTAILGVIVIVIIKVLDFVFKNKGIKTVAKKSRVIFFMFFIAIVFFVFVMYGDLFVSQLSIVLDYMHKTINPSSSNVLDSSRIIHTRYWTSLFFVAQQSGILHVLFGYGLGCSGYPFIKFFRQFGGTVKGTWVVECDQVNFIWSHGIIYALYWYILLIHAAIKSFRFDERYSIFIIGIIIEGITYNVTFNWVFILMILLFQNIYEQKKFILKSTN